MRASHRALLFLVVGLAVLTALAAFPTDALVRRALERLPLPGGQRLEFVSAHLRPWGLRLDGVVLHRGEGLGPLRADWVRVRPALLGLVRGRRGFPWRAAVGICAGRIDLALDAERTGFALVTTFHDLDVAPCLQQFGAGSTWTGRLDGSAQLRFPTGTAPAGAGELRLRSATWHPPMAWLDDTVFHVDRGLIRWTLAPEVLHLDLLDLRGSEVEILARGETQLRSPLQESQLRLRVELTPMPGMPLQLRQLLRTFPTPASGPQVLLVSGPLRAPRVGPESSIR